MTDIKLTSNQYYLYVLKLLFYILKPIRNKYKLTINAIIVLNSCYLYSKIVKDQFYINDIYLFTGYYNKKFTNFYFKVLTQGGFIVAINPCNHRVLHKITDKGIEVINSIEQYYNRELYSFYNKYGIE